MLLLGWGNATDGQLGPSSSITVSIPKPLPLTQPESIAAGVWTSAIVAHSGKAVYTTTLKQGESNLLDAPFTLVPGTAIPPERGELPAISSAAVGRDFMLLLSASGSVYAIGGGAYGQLGHGEGVGTLTRASELVALRSVRIVAVAAAEFHWLALDHMGRVFACGHNSHGQLGMAKGNLHTPTVVQALWPQPVVAISTGDQHSAVLTALGDVLCFGSNKWGQLGLAKFRVQVMSTVPVMVQVPGREERDVSMTDPENSVDLLGIVGDDDGDDDDDEDDDDKEIVPNYIDVACGGGHTVALLSDGSLVTWGKGENGQLGNRGGGVEYEPRRAAGKGFVRVSAGYQHSAALTKEGALFMWGDGELGQIGDGEMNSKFVPVAVKSEKFGKGGFTEVVCGGHHTLGLVAEEGERVKETGYQGRIARCVVDGMVQSRVGISRFGCGAVLLRTFVDGKKGPLSRGKVNVQGILMAYAGFLRLFGDEGRRMLGIAASRIRHEAQLAFGLIEKEGGSFAFGAEKYVTEDMPRLIMLKARFVNDDNLFRSSVANCYECGYLFLLALLNPIYGERGRVGELAEMANVLLKCEENGREAFLQMLSYCPEELMITHFIRPFQTLLTEDLKIYSRVRRNAKLAAMALALCYHAVWRASRRKRIRGLVVPRKEFYNETVSERVDLKADYDRWSESQGENGRLELSELPPLPVAGQEDRLFSFCTYSFLLSETAKFQILEMESHRTMDKESMRSVITFGSLPMPLGPWGRFTNIRIPAEQIAQLQYLVLKVQRHNIVSDAFVQVAEYAKHHPRELLKPLKVIFYGEEGVDEGGVQKEFYQVLLEHVLSADYGMFEYDEETRFHWFRKDSLESENSWSLIGIMFGLAAFNSILLDVQFPPVFYRKLEAGLRNGVGKDENGEELEGYKGDLGDVKETFPALGKSIEQLLRYEGDDVEEVFCLDFEVSYQGLFGKVETVELVPGGANKRVTKTNRAEFASLYIDYLINKSIEPAFTHFARGFSFMLRGPFVHMFSADELETLLVGEKELDFVALKKAAKYEGYTENSVVVEHLWQVLMEYPEEMKRLFLSFVTGTDRAPIGGLQKLQLVIQRAEGDSNRLPTSHTCFNVLLLPDYATRAKLRDRLSTAIQNSKGFYLR